MQGMMQIVVPLCGAADNSAFRSSQIPRLIAVVLKDEMDVAIGNTVPDGLDDFADYVGLAVVKNRMSSIETQPVEMKLLEPIERVLNKKVAYFAALRSVEIDCSAPWRLVALAEEIRSDRRQIIALGAKMIIDDIEKYRQTPRVARLDKSLQRVRQTILRRRGIEKHAVVTPITGAGKRSDRHQLDRSCAELDDMIEMLDGSGEAAAAGESAEMQLVNDNLFPTAAAPAGIAPIIRPRIDDLARTVHALGLIARSRVRKGPAVDEVTIVRPRHGDAGRRREPAARLVLHRDQLGERLLDLQEDRACSRRPEPEASFVRPQLGPERQVTVPAHRAFPARRYGPRQNSPQGAARG